MNDLEAVAPAFVEMAHRIVWCTVATVDPDGRPRSRVLHPLWQWNGTELIGWIGTTPTPAKRAHLDASPFVSCSYWTPSHDTCVAECRASWIFDDAGRVEVWERFKAADPPVGYDPGIVPTWGGPTAAAFAALRLEPWRLRVCPGAVLLGRGGDVLTWRRAHPAA